MAPKTRIFKEDVLRAAVELIRKEGEQALNARRIATVLNCSTQPVFSNFATMEELRQAVVEAAEALFQNFMNKEMESGLYPPYKASGMAYIRFAREEKELFKLLYMRDRAAEKVPEETELGNQMEGMVQGNTGLGSAEARLFHLEMWAYVHGVASMLATGYLDLDWQLISRMLTDAYQGLKKQYEKE